MLSSKSITVIFVLLSIHEIKPSMPPVSSTRSSTKPENDYLRYVKDGCFLRGEALSCVKYKALKIAKTAILGSHGNETIKANQMISFVPLDEDTVRRFEVEDEEEIIKAEPRSIFSEWTELTRYLMKLVKDFFRVKGLRVELPDGSRTIEEETDDHGRGKRKKLALIVPLLTFLATLKMKVLLIPILLAVLLIKKLLLIAALLVPSLLNTLKHCKHHPHFSVFGASEVSDFSSDYGSNYAYSSGNGYSKDWATNRAHNMPKYRPTPAPVYITAPGAVA